MNRCELHSHTMYSNLRLLDSNNKPIDLINYAKEIGLKGIAITDHESLSCHIKVNKYQKEIGNDFKIILGNEIYLTDTRDSGLKYYHFILLAKDKIGHKQLRQLSSRAWMLSYFDRGMERVPTLKDELREVVTKNPGHLIATTACLGGELSSCVLEMENARHIEDIETANKKKEQIIKFVLEMKEIFGDDFYFEIAPAANKEQIIVNKKIAELSKVFNIKMVLGSDAHYLKHEDRFIHEAFLNSKGGERETAQFYEYAYLQTEEEIIKNLTPSIVDLYEEMCNNSIEIMDKCEIYDLTHSQQIPKVEVKDYSKVKLDGNEDEMIFSRDYPILTDMYNSDNNIERYWVNECINNLCQKKNWTFNDLINYGKQYTDRLEEEADIKKTIGEKLDTNMFLYPITLQHYVDLFWECRSPVGAGRGSSCSGLNHYLLGVTQLDPIEWDLPFWRYLNKERLELGDIDIDIAPSKRPLILQKIREERGLNFLPEIDDLSREHLGCTLIATFGTESSKSAVLTACRGYRSEEYTDGIDNDTAQYLSSLIPQERGFVWSLHDVVYGNKDKGRLPITTFVNEVEKYPKLLDIMLGVEGLVSRRGSHASGVILFDEDPYEFGCFMKTPSGDIITQYDLHDDEAAGLTKYDFLVTSIQDKIAQAIKFLQDDEQIDSHLTLREVYNKYLHPEVMDIDNPDVWENIQNVSVLDLFQFDSAVGSQAAKKLKPNSVLELADANGLMRLMTAEKGAETPMDKYYRFKNNISLWYQEMDRYGLTKEEQEYLKPHFLRSHGVPPSQEQMMTMLMDKHLCSFSLKDANKARKIVGKKKMAEIPALKEKVMAQAKREALGKYIWDCGIGPQMGYSFSIIHALAYSFIGYQSAYIATKWDPIYWNTACLVVNSESLETENNKKEKGADYGKIAKAIGDITDKGINVSLININESDYSFKPDVKNNRILYGLKALSNINSDIIEKIKAGRPYISSKDFIDRCPLGKVAMVNLIKAGAFDELDKQFGFNRYMTMAYYINLISEPKKKLTLVNFNGLIQHSLVPKEYELEIRIFNFNKFLKSNMKNDEYYIFNDICIEFWNRFLNEYTDSLEVINGITCIKQKNWDKIYQSYMDIVREWLKANQTELLNQFNLELFKEMWNKYAEGNISKWEIDSLCFYYHDHELKNVNIARYGITDFNKLSRDPAIDYFFKKAGKEIPIYKLYKIIGTVIAKDDNRSTVTLLTTTGVVNVKLTREYYAMFKKQISEIQPDGKKKRMEKSWFVRGTKLMFTGFRREDTFVGKTYSKTVGHQLYKIEQVLGDEIKITHERYTSSSSEEEEEYEYS